MFSRKSDRLKKLKKIRNTQLRASKRKSFLEQLEQRLLLNSDWQNPILSIDSNNDLRVSPIDALLVINSLNSKQDRLLFNRSRTSALDPYIDTSGDAMISPLDALLVINTLNSGSPNLRDVQRTEGEAAPAPAGFLSIPMTKLPGKSGQVVPLATTLEIGREEFNELGIFVADDEVGRVNGIAPGQPGYAEAVFNSTQRRVLYSRFSTFRADSESNLPAGSYAHVYVLQETSNNGDPDQHLRARQVSTNLMQVGWEEHISPFGGWPQVGDRGYDDATVDFQFGEPIDGNAEPVLRAISNQSINELNQIAIVAFAMDADMPDDVIAYSLDVAPTGAVIDSVTGRISWTPTEANGPGNFEFLVRATDIVGAFDTESFFVTVLEVNQSPLLAPIADITAKPGELLTFQANAVDPDSPANILRYSLGPGAPAGASLDPISGQFRWTPSESQNSQAFRFTVRVSDNGTPALTAEQSVSITVGSCLFAPNFTGVTTSESGGSTQGMGSIDTSSCAAKITEGDSFSVILQADFTVPTEPSYLEFDRRDLLFDVTNDFINDAFEAALVDKRGNSLVHKISGSRDAFFNSTEGHGLQLGANTRVDGDTVKVDLEHLAPGTEARLLLRLINNDRDGASTVRVSNVELVKGSLGTPLSITGDARADSRLPSSIDFASLQDVSASMSPVYGRTSFEQQGEVLQVDLAIRNQGSYSVNHPLIVVVDHISDPSIRVTNADGVTPAGLPYFDFSLADKQQLFNPNDVTGSRQILFRNPDGKQFNYDIVVLSQPNREPVITSEAITEAFVGRPYAYELEANDPDGDALSYFQITGPENSLSGKTLNWTPSESDLGTHTFAIRVEDGRGGAAMQQFTVTVSQTPPNRPPVFTTTPVVDSNIGQPYVYDANANDVDDDTLTYRLIDSPPGMSIDSATGQITWTPGGTSSKTWDAAEDFSAQENPGGPWSYGTMSSPGSVLHRYPRHTNIGGLHIWSDPNIATTETPTVIYNGGQTAFSSPPNGSALRFDGVDDFVHANDSLSLRPTSLTLEGWANFESIPPIAVLFGKPFGTAWLNSYQIWYHEGQLKAGVSDGSKLSVISFSWTPTLSQWYHVAFTFNDVTDNLALYIDGALVAVGTTEASIAYDSRPFEIGKDIENGAPNYHFKGSLDEVRLWNVARTGDEIRGTIFRSLTGNEPGLAAYYPFHASATNIVPDLGPNQNQGTLSVDGPTYVDSSVPFPFQVAGNGDGLTWHPGQLSLHPGGENQRSVVRWTAPVAGKAEINAVFSSMDGFQSATTDVHVLFNGKSLFDGNINGRGSTSAMPSTTVEVTVGDTIDFLVGFANGSADYDTTLVDTSITMQVASTSVPVAIHTDDGRGGTAIQSFDIAVLPKSGNREPAFVSTPITSLPKIRPAYASRLLETLDPGSVITGLAVSNDERLYIGNLSGPLYQRDLVSNTLSVLKAGSLSSSARMLVSDGGPWGTDLIHADNNFGPSNNNQGAVFRTNPATGDSTVIQSGTFGRSIGDPFGVAFGRGGAFGTDLYVMDPQGASSQGPVMNRITSTGQVVTFAEGGPWSNDSLPVHIELSPGGLFGEYIYVADRDSQKIWRVSPTGQITPFNTSVPVAPVSIRFSPSGGFGEDLYALEANGRIVRIESDGKVTPFALQVATVDPNESILPDMVFSNDGSRLYLGISNRIYEITANTRYAYPALAIDADNDTLTYSLVAGPDGMKIDPASGLITWDGQEKRIDREGPATTNGLALSAAAQAAGYRLMEFARGIPVDNGVGPLGIAFTRDGGVLVSDHGGRVRKFADGFDGQNAATIVPAQSYGFGRAFDMAQVGDKIYMSQRDSGTVVQINQDGTFNQLIVDGLAAPHGIVVNPTNGHLIVSSYSANAIYDIDPLAKTKTVLFSASLDGICISPDGSILYGAAAPSGLDRIYGFSLVPGSIGNVVFESGVVPGHPDGTALGMGDSAGLLFANTLEGTVLAIDLKTKQQTLIASGGTRGDFVKVDPYDGTLLLTQSSTIARLQLPAGSSFRTDFNVGIRVEDGRGGSDVQNFVLQLTDGTAEIRGQVRQDPSTQANPLGLPDFVVYLDQNQNGLLDSDERYTTTDTSGNYSFSGLIAASYTVSQGVHSGWRQTGPVDGAYSITLVNGQSTTGVDFINIPSTVAEIRGTKFHDLNDDGVRSLAPHTVNVTVPGVSDPWLAGMPNGSTASSGDVAPAQSPVQVTGLSFVPGSSVSFRATGSVSYVPSPSGNPPDGDLNFFVLHGAGAENGISNVNSPANSLIAVFLGPDQPNLTPAPTTLDFSASGNVLGGIEYRSLSPQLKQLFFVGDGRTNDGQSQQIIVPQGATRLFLGTMDGSGWFNNSGAFEVDVTGLQLEPGLRGWTIYLDKNSNGLRDPNEPSTLTDSNGQYALTNVVPDTYVVAEETYPTYDAVRDFSANQNPNSPWTYGLTQTRGTEFQKLERQVLTPQLAIWQGTDRGPNLIGNLTGNTIPGGITYPPDVLSLDPSFDGRNSVLRFTAPVTDTYHVSGRFQGIDLTRGPTTDVAILQNSSSILAGNINGFFRDLATTPGALLPFDLQVSLRQGDTLDFSVGRGPDDSLFDSTGVSAIIVGENWRQTAPVTKTHQINVVAGEVRKLVDFGNLELAAQPAANHPPRITSTALTETGVGARYRLQAKATDVDRDRLTFDLPVKPAGMIVDPSTGLIVWTPAADQAGVQNVILRVRDGKGGVDLQSFQISVESRNSGPTITSRPPGPAQANLPYQYRIRAQDAEGDAIEFGLNNPAIGNMAVDAATGVFSWLPSSSDIGSHTIEVTATDASGDGQLQKFTLEVLASAPNRVPEVLSTPRDQVRLGNSYIYALDAFDADGDPLAYRFDVAPSGMTIDANGMITWTPTAEQFGDNPVQVSVSDGRGGVRNQTFSIAVLSQAENQAPIISSTATLAATLGIGYRYTVKATDADGDTLAYSLDTKPNGMSIDALSGAMRWTPTADQLGAHSIIVRVTDPQGASATQSFTVTVRGSNLPPEISSAPRTTAAVGRAYSYGLKAIDPEGGPLTYALAQKSGNMVIDSSGMIQWVPGVSEVGSINVVVRVSDDQGGSVEQSFTVVVDAIAPNQPPVITSQPILGALVGQPYQYQVTAEDPDGGQFRFAFLEVPNGMTIDESTGLIRWTSDAAGIGRVTVLVGDFDGGEAEQSFEVTVRGSNEAPQITSNPVFNTATGVTYRYDVRANDPNFDPLSYALVTGPAGMAIDNLGRITWTTSTADAGTHRVKLSVADDQGASAVQEYDLVVAADTEAPKIRIQVDSNPVGLNETLTIQVNATDNIGVKTFDVSVDGKVVALDSRGRATVLMSRTGSVRIEAVAIDAAGNSGRQNLDVLVVDKSVTDAPTVDVTTPTENATITAPTDVIGTVQDPNLVSWKLEVAPFEGVDFKQIATGTNQVTNGKIATFDPTMLQNDSYILRLTALNTGGLSSSIDTVVNVAGNLKLGNFTLSFTDLSIPVAGIPITITRTYDTLNANHNGEMGFGWKLAFRDVDLRTSVPKTGDEAGGLYTPFRDGTRVYVTLPGGQREGFTFRPKAVGLFDPNQRERDVPPGFQSGNGFNAVYFVPSFVPDKGVTDKLTAPRYQLSKQGSEYFQFGGGLPYNPTDPAYGARFTLNTKDGISFLIDADRGQLRSASDRNGNSLNFTEDAITASSGPTITLARDAQRRIISASDPAGKSIRYRYDANGNLITVADRDNNLTQFTYLAAPPNYLDKVIDPLGRTGLKTTFDSVGRLIGVSGSTGSTSNVSYDQQNNRQVVIDALGNTTTFQYDNQGNAVSQVDALGGTILRTFDDNNNLTSETDPLGNRTLSSYDINGNRVSQTDALGNLSFTIYDANNQITSITDPLGRTTHNKFDGSGNLIGTIDPLGNLTSNSFDPKGNLVSTANALGSITRMNYDGQGHLVQQIDALGHGASFTYDTYGNRLTSSTQVTTPAGIQTLTSRVEYDANENQVKKTDRSGATIENLYDAVGNLIATSDARGFRTEYVYNELNQLTKVTYPDGRSYSSTYDVLGREVSTTDQGGRTTNYTYDALGRQTLITYPDGTKKEIQFDAAGRMIASIDALQNRTQYNYDALGRQTQIIDSQGNKTTTVYDAAGQTISTTDALGRTTQHVFDLLGREVQTIFADGSRIDQTFDALGSLTTTKDQNGKITTFSYDVLGRNTAVIDALGQTANVQYDELGRLVAQTDPNGNTTRYQYDGAGRRVATQLPMGQKSTVAVDANGNVVSTTDPKGQTNNYQYDSINRLVKQTFPDGSTYQYTYTPTGKRATSTDRSGSSSYTYDSMDRLTRITKPDGQTIAYQYDAAGRQTSVIDASGTTTYGYDNLNRLAQVQSAQGKITVYKYDAIGNKIETSFPNGLVETDRYDLLNRMVSQRFLSTTGTNISFNYSLDAVGNLIAKTEEFDSARVTYVYAYDSLYRITAENITGLAPGPRTIAYSYDAAGNLLTNNDSSSGIITSTYNANNQLLTQTASSGTTGYTYDENGNLVARVLSQSDQTIYRWDVLNRLTQVETTSANVTNIGKYEYDVDGNRTTVIVNGKEARHLVDPNSILSQQLLEYSPSGAINSSYVHGLGLISMLRGGNESYYLIDRLGSTRALTNINGQITDRYDYGAYGNLIFQAGTTSNSYLFTGQQFDPISASYYLRARYYDPVSTRFLSRDTVSGSLSDSLSWNQYLYAKSNPLNLIDPTGNTSWDLRSLVVSVGINVGISGAIGLGSAKVFNYEYTTSNFLIDVLMGAIGIGIFRGLYAARLAPISFATPAAVGEAWGLPTQVVRIAQSPQFWKNVEKGLGRRATAVERKAFYAKVENLEYNFQWLGGYFHENTFQIGRIVLGRESAIRHELGHVFDSVINPKIFEEVIAQPAFSKRTLEIIVGAELKAFAAQGGIQSALRVPYAYLTAIVNVVGQWKLIGLTSLGFYRYNSNR